MNAKKMPAFPSVTRPKGQFLCFIRQKIIILWMENFYLSCLSKMFPLSRFLVNRQRDFTTQPNPSPTNRKGRQLNPDLNPIVNT